MIWRLIRKLRELRGLHAEMRTLRADFMRQTDLLHEFLDDFKCSFELDQSVVDSFHDWKKTAVVREQPLVSICVSTYNRPELLVSRCLPSLIGQTYKNIEIIIVGDHCSDDVVEAIGAVTDPRLRFVNLPERGAYPSLWQLQWCVAGTAPDNHALEIARGDYITHLDDDDEYLPNRIEALVSFAREKAADVVYHPFWIVSKQNLATVVEASHFHYGQVTTGSVFYRSWFARIPYDIKAYILREPGDWNRFRKFRYVRPVIRRYSEPLLRHYESENMVERTD